MERDGENIIGIEWLKNRMLSVAEVRYLENNGHSPRIVSIWMERGENSEKCRLHGCWDCPGQGQGLVLPEDKQRSCSRMLRNGVSDRKVFTAQDFKKRSLDRQLRIV